MNKIPKDQKAKPEAARMSLSQYGNFQTSQDVTKEKIDGLGRLEAISENGKRKQGRDRKFSDESDVGRKTHSVVNNMISNILDEEGVDNNADARRGETASNSIFSDNFLKDEKY